MKLSERMKISANTPESYLDFKQKRIMQGWIDEAAQLEAQIERLGDMGESTREYWRNPRLYASEDELHISVPEFYAQEGHDVISSWIVDTLEAVGLQHHQTILEIGCNCGRNLNMFMKRGYRNLWGVEISPEAVEYSHEVFPLVSDRIVCRDAQSFLAEQKTGAFNVIFTQGVLMHIPRDDMLFAQMARVANNVIFTNEVESVTPFVILERHKHGQNYKEVFEAFDGWRQIMEAPFQSSMTRVFQRLRLLPLPSDISHWEVGG